MAEPTVITVTELRKDLDRILHRVLLKRESFVITKHDRPYALLTPMPEEKESRSGHPHGGGESRQPFVPRDQ